MSEDREKYIIAAIALAELGVIILLVRIIMEQV